MQRYLAKCQIIWEMEISVYVFEGKCMILSGSLLFAYIRAAKFQTKPCIFDFALRWI